MPVAPTRPARACRMAAMAVIAGMIGCAAPGRPSPEPEPLVRQVADRVLVDFPEPPPFDWGEGVLMAGMMRAGIVLNEPRYIDFVRRWADHWNARGIAALLPDGPTDQIKGYCGYWGPGYPVLLLYERTGEKAYLDMVLTIADFILSEATRTADGGLGHWKGNRELWVDTLYMVCPPFAHLTRLTGDRRYLQEAVRQIDIYRRHTFDEKANLFWHMYDELADRRVGVLWARGNGWVAMSYVQTLAVLERGSTDFRRLHDDYLRLIAGLQAAQDRDTGLWHTVLDHPETYLETSAGAMILCSLVEARRLKILPESQDAMIALTWRGVASKVDGEGRVVDVSGGTMPDALEVYATKLKGTFTWGTGAFLLAGSALAEDR